jgi:hypothetical protein
MFDIAAEIITDKNFEDLTVLELVEAMNHRLLKVLINDDREAFGFCDECEDINSNKQKT